MRILLYTGKGGAGKTTIAAATAVRCSETHRRTLLVGTDPSQSLSGCLNHALGPEPQQVAPNLCAQELDPLSQLERTWPRLQPLLDTAFGSDLAATAVEELTLGPGVGDVLRLLALLEHCERAEYDILVLDAGSSFNALRLLAAPDGAAWWIERLFGSRAVPGQLTEGADSLAERLANLRSILADAGTTSVRVVTTAERLGVYETKRALTSLGLYGYNVDAIILNRHKRVPQVVADAFGAWPILCLTLYDRDVIGQKLLSDMGAALFPPPADPAAFLVQDQAQRLTRGPQGYVLSLRLPFVTEEDIDLLQHQGQLILQVNRARRVIQLPPPVDSLSAADAVIEDGTLEIHFR